MDIIIKRQEVLESIKQCITFYKDIEERLPTIYAYCKRIGLKDDPLTEHRLAMLQMDIWDLEELIQTVQRASPLDS